MHAVDIFGNTSLANIEVESQSCHAAESSDQPSVSTSPGTNILKIFRISAGLMVRLEVQKPKKWPNKKPDVEFKRKLSSFLSHHGFQGLC